MVSTSKSPKNKEPEVITGIGGKPSILSLPVVLLAIYGYHIISLQEGLLVLSISVIFTLIMLPINNAGFLTFGNKKGTILYVVTLVAFVIGFITLNFFVGIEQLLLNFISNFRLSA
mgnify:CR=1 FL=1